ncbi:M15 family metallopeptidase [Risungbinella massiliensis]|uniref:M15 family metallopeptidase n=1 Tax=Risungbinella massiliensis TaxID=1329796 RepID=UPI0009E3863E|nr:M15 family metallopeptidase [Risungbinella massiliensis]
MEPRSRRASRQKKSDNNGIGKIAAVIVVSTLLIGLAIFFAINQEDKGAKNASEETKKETTPSTTEPTKPSSSEPQIELTEIQMLVNKEHGLDEDYVPPDLIVPKIKFVYQTAEIKQMQRVAAESLEKMFEAAKQDGLPLAGVSGYRSYKTQKILYNNYVKRDGQEAADRYSAKPGHSEHMTGLTMDIAGYSGKCAASDCFHNTKEAQWLKDNAYKYGFILRYPPGKEEITGYKHESWHYRYVGEPLAKFIYEKQITLEEYYETYAKK